jgi:hypothetical protein
MAKIWGTGNVLRSEKIAHIASWRNFVFATFAGMSFSTAQAISRNIKRRPLLR